MKPKNYNFQNSFQIKQKIKTLRLKANNINR